MSRGRHSRRDCSVRCRAPETARHIVSTKVVWPWTAQISSADAARCLVDQGRGFGCGFVEQFVVQAEPDLLGGEVRVEHLRGRRKCSAGPAKARVEIFGTRAPAWSDRNFDAGSGRPSKPPEERAFFRARRQRAASQLRPLSVDRRSRQIRPFRRPANYYRRHSRCVHAPYRCEARYHHN